jgi:hypothetical protein
MDASHLKDMWLVHPQDVVPSFNRTGSQNYGEKLEVIFTANLLYDQIEDTQSGKLEEIYSWDRCVD